MCFASNRAQVRRVPVHCIRPDSVSGGEEIGEGVEEIREGGVYLPDEWLFSKCCVAVCTELPLILPIVGRCWEEFKSGETWRRHLVEKSICLSLERFQIGCTNSSQVAKSSHISRWKTRETQSRDLVFVL